MAHSKLYIGNSEFKINQIIPNGEYVTLNEEVFYRIGNYESMKPFFMSIVSDSDHWMFISSNGSLTAGRKNPENALFPYYTVDKIHDSYEKTGSKTILKVNKEDKTFLWEPFSNKYQGIYSISRNLYKNIQGNHIIFEEVNSDLELIFRYSWNNSGKFGFIRIAEIKNLGKTVLRIELLDGIQNILPFGVNRMMQNDKSPLVEAYKKSELVESSKLGLFLLSSIPVDRAEPSEALKATTVWMTGIEPEIILISSIQLDSFRNGKNIETETEIRARSGAYFIKSSESIEPNLTKKWFIVADVNQSASMVANLNKFLIENINISTLLLNDISAGTESIKKLVSKADGIQLTNDKLSSNRQFSNVLFNSMRGGIFSNGYLIDKNDFSGFVKDANYNVFKKHTEFLNSLPNEIIHTELIAKIESLNDIDLLRIAKEYLPLSFSRRHGDPSRPWNLFSIDIKNEDGSQKLNYQGNWRDIFQNWEALALSFPGFVESMICKFANASTIDGYNPYRVTKDGFEWEIHNESDPWSFIGYWGDHQIIYFLKFLEILENYYPGKFEKFLQQEIFTFANVPYKIKPYSEIVKNPYDTIRYDKELEKIIEKRVHKIGNDGKLIVNVENKIHYVNLTEKILIAVLAKLGNFIPEAGIWLNTQRPEWNDANNALVGNGVSMVTLYYLRRYLKFLEEKFKNSELNEITISSEVKTLFNNILSIFSKYEPLINIGFDNKTRKSILNELGFVVSNYRETVYSLISTERTKINLTELLKFFKISIAFIDQTINLNQRSDKLYHAYNLISFQSNGELSISNLYEMLEGQVSVLSSGKLSSKESLEVILALRKSAMFWPEEYSYLLYPDRKLPIFITKNNLSSESIQKSSLLSQLVKDRNTQIIEIDETGIFHFKGKFTNKNLLLNSLNDLKSDGYKNFSDNDVQYIINLYEETFNHKSFTGRSGTFFGYEGLGCIYWHMVSKLLLAVQEICYQSSQNSNEIEITKKLVEAYYDIRKGLGINKSPGKYGAFPTDPYSHTPGHGGAQQPGMTGQVKEDIITRFGELGLFVREGSILFNNLLLRKSEFLTNDSIFSFYDLNGLKQNIELTKGSLAYTFCNIPIIYNSDSEVYIKIMYNTTSTLVKHLVIDKLTCNSIFERKGTINKIEVCFGG
jgi:hypothetical protein